MKIKNLKLESNVFLAPMAGVCDLPFRLICKQQGCGLVFSEMISAKGIVFNNENTKSMLETSKEERPVAIQIFGSEPSVLAEAASIIEKYPFDILDINIGCPAPKIVKNGDGSALLKNPDLVYKIVKATCNAINKPVTVKIRKGFDENSVTAVDVAKAAQEGGACAVSVHGRLAKQYYSGVADWDIIAKVKQCVNIPVIGNGDINSPQDALKMLEQTGCDGVMIGRASQGNPWIFKRTVHYLKTGELLPEPSVSEKINMALIHGEMLVKYKGEYIGVREMRRHLSFYVKGIDNCTKLRVQINKATTFLELKDIFWHIV